MHGQKHDHENDEDDDISLTVQMREEIPKEDLHRIIGILRKSGAVSDSCHSRGQCANGLDGGYEIVFFVENEAVLFKSVLSVLDEAQVGYIGTKKDGLDFFFKRTLPTIRTEAKDEQPYPGLGAALITNFPNTDYLPNSRREWRQPSVLQLIVHRVPNLA